ncbi:neutral/alkaline ceramidase, partial [bacterium]|nr:neutral/alkaline ceramidase [bacterium]
MKGNFFACHLSWIFITIMALIAIPAQAGEWIVGAGIYDITGPAADRGMVGYGSTDQTTQGIHIRLWSRAFTIGKPGTDSYIVFVSADIQSITQGVHQGVMERIAADSSLSPYLNKNNVMLTATHTHVGPGGYDHTAMLNMSALGYDNDNYNTIVNGIYQSIVVAFNSKTEGSIKIAQGQLTGVSMNRGSNAYVLNDDHTDYATDVNDTMTVLKLVNDNGDEVGLIDWFAVHNVSGTQDFRLISGDNKGVASQLFESLKGTQPPLNRGFVAAFANSEEGDVSPNICGSENGCGDSTQASILLAGTKQFNKALTLYNSATETLSGELAYQFQYVKMPGYQVDSQYTGTGSDETICEGTIGWSMTAGVAQDGPTNIAGVREGMTQENEGTYWNKDVTLFGNVFAGYPLLGIMDALSNATNLFGLTGDTQHEACQSPKPTFLNIKLSDTIYLYTDTLPFQLFQIGELVLVGVPGEMTTMSARRLRSDLESILASHGVEHIVIAGLANAYSGYITTPEEYSVQYYAGGHTLFGPNTLAAYRQVFSEQAKAIVNNETVDAGPTPRDWSDDQIINAIGVVYDDKRLWESFGQVWTDASPGYLKGSTVTVKFRSGHPQNNFLTMDAFLQV